MQVLLQLGRHLLLQTPSVLVWYPSRYVSCLQLTELHNAHTVYCLASHQPTTSMIVSRRLTPCSCGEVPNLCVFRVQAVEDMDGEGLQSRAASLEGRIAVDPTRLPHDAIGPNTRSLSNPGPKSETTPLPDVVVSGLLMSYPFWHSCPSRQHVSTHYHCIHDRPFLSSGL